jgi:hypothetical protein
MGVFVWGLDSKEVLVVTRFAEVLLEFCVTC